MASKKGGSTASSSVPDEFNFDTGVLIKEGATPNWTRDFPVVGEGTFIFSIQRSTPFSIVVRPKLDPGEPGANQWIALEVHKVSANLKMCIGDDYKQLKQVQGIVKNEQVGYDPGRKISYWFSYDRDLLTLKYGKGYRMQQTTLMEFKFLTGDEKIDENTRKTLQYLFSPTIRRRIEQYDLGPRKEMVQRYAARIREAGLRGQTLSPNLTAKALGVKSESVATSIIDIENQVNFDKDPFVCNWSPFVLDSSKVDLFELDDNNFTFSASLPPACRELYSNVTAPNVDLDWSPKPTKYRLSDAIRYSLQGPNGKLYKKLLSKKDQFGHFNQTYLRVTLGSNRGNSPGIPYVLEIWPTHHGSPIHNHGNAYAVVRVLHGGLTIKVFNKHVDRRDASPLKKFDVKAGDTTWISPNWFQTHKLWNGTSDYCATVQCYQYGATDVTHWPYFDYVASTRVIDEFLPDSDYTFHEMREMVLKEYIEFMDHVSTVN